MTNVETPQEALLTNLNRFRSEGKFCDVVVVAAGERLPAHRIVLAAASSPLRSFFRSQCQRGVKGDDFEAQEPLELRLTGISRPESLRLVLDVAYACRSQHAEAELPRGVAQDVIRLATALRLPVDDDVDK
ncbi:unnamed protein product, partial [Polarella glacialis]